MTRTSLETRLIEAIEDLDALHREKHKTSRGDDRDIDGDCVLWGKCPLAKVQAIVNRAQADVIRHDLTAGLGEAR